MGHNKRKCGICRSMMEMANSDTKVEQIDALVDSMFENAGLDNGSSLTFEDFADVFSDKLDMLWDVCLDWKGVCFVFNFI